MDFEVYCDESRQELFTQAGSDIEAYTLIGSLWLKADSRRQYNSEIKDIRKRHSIYREFKWTKVSQKNVPFCCDLVRFFYKEGDNLRFRCIVLPVKDLDAAKFHEADNELMFYKFYYQLLHHWILDNNKYRIYVDMKTNRVRRRLNTLRQCLDNANIMSEVEFVQALPSQEVQLIQLTDLLTGAVGYRFHSGRNSQAKEEVLREVEKGLGHEINPTTRDCRKFNIFRFVPGGGW